MESHIAGGGAPGLPAAREPDLAGLAAFLLDSGGRVVSWSVTATALFGQPASAVIGQDLCDVLMTGPGQRQLVRHALAEVATGRVWATTVAGGERGEGRCRHPLGADVRARWWCAGDRPACFAAAGPGWLSEAAARIGSTLDLTKTAAEIVDAAVPGFADAAILYVAERMLVADEVTSPPAGHGAVVRRLAARLAGQDAAVTGELLRSGEVLVFSENAHSAQAMATGVPVLFDHLDDESGERLARRPGGREVAAGYTRFVAVPLAARGVVLGCALFAGGSAARRSAPARSCWPASLPHMPR